MTSEDLLLQQAKRLRHNEPIGFDDLVFRMEAYLAVQLRLLLRDDLTDADLRYRQGRARELAELIKLFTKAMKDD